MTQDGQNDIIKYGTGGGRRIQAKVKWRHAPQDGAGMQIASKALTPFGATVVRLWCVYALYTGRFSNFTHPAQTSPRALDCQLYMPVITWRGARGKKQKIRLFLSETTAKQLVTPNTRKNTPYMWTFRFMRTNTPSI